jgi:hypothetical protein
MKAREEGVEGRARERPEARKREGRACERGAKKMRARAAREGLGVSLACM